MVSNGEKFTNYFRQIVYPSGFIPNRMVSLTTNS